MSQLFLCHKDDIAEHQAQGFSIETEQGPLDLFAIKYQDQIYAYKNHCPHLGIPLNWQPDQFLSQGSTHIQCSTHGALFNLDTGHCVAGPCAGQDLEALPLKYNEDGSIWLNHTHLV